MGNDSSTLVDQLNKPPTMSRGFSMPCACIIRTAICESFPSLHTTKTITKTYTFNK